MNSKQQTPFPSQIIRLESNVLLHPSLLRFNTLLEWFLLDIPQLFRYIPLDGLRAFKSVPLVIPFRMGRKSHTEQNQENREDDPVRWCSSWARSHRCSRRWEQVHFPKSCPTAKACVKMQWLQKAKTTVIYTQDIMWDGNTTLLSQSWHITPNPVTFLTDLVLQKMNEFW